MASMFDVNETMSSVVESQMQQMSGFEARLEDLNERVDSVKSMVESSISSIDDSITKIEEVTDNILSSAQDSLQEQQNQIQIMESEKEVDEMKFKSDTGVQENPDLILKRLSEMITELKYGVKNILDEKRVGGSNIKDIDAGDKLTLKAALSTIFGASVLGYLFMDSAGGSEDKGGTEASGADGAGSAGSEAPKQEENTEQSSENSDASNMGNENAEESSNNTISEKTPQEAPGEDVESSPQEVASEEVTSSPQEMPSEGVSKNYQTEVKPLNDMADQNMLTPVESSIVLRERAMKSGELIKTDEAYYYPDGKVVNVNKGLSTEEETKLIESGAELYTKFLMEDNEENRKEFPGLWDDQKEKVAANKPSTGNNLMESNKQVEKAEDTTRSNIAQNMVTVVNQAAPEAEKPAPKNTAVIGKVTLDKILT